MIEVTLEVGGEVQLKRKLSRFGSSFKNIKPLLRDIAKDFKSIEAKQFKSQGSYGSGGWERLSFSYAKWKSKNYPGKPILQRSGRLMSSLTGFGSDYIERMTNSNIELGTMTPYAIYHQSVMPRTKLPRRPVIELTESDKKRWMKMAQSYAVASAKKAGLL